MNRSYYILAIMVLILVFIIIMLWGCQVPQPIDTSTMTDAAKIDILETKEKLVYIYETNKLAVSFYIALAASVLMIIQRVKFGWGLLGASIIGLVAIRLDQTLASTYQWVYLVVAGLVGVGIAFYVWRTYIDKRAMSEIVGSVQTAFEKSPDWDKFKTNAKITTSKSTQKMVKQVKGDLK